VTHEWKQTGEAGVICLGDTGFIVWYDSKDHLFRWKAPNGKAGWTATLSAAKNAACRFYKEMAELGLTLS